MFPYLYLLLFPLFFALPVFAISEKDFFTEYQEKVSPFYNSCEQLYFLGTDQKRINYLKYESEKEETAVVLLPGKSESYIKYAEFIYDLKKHDFSFYMMDHQGMGFSERSIAHNQDKVFVKNYDGYLNDLRIFMEEIVFRKKHKNLFLISHSMGGTVAALYLESFPNDFNGAVFVSPMIKINTGIFPETAADMITRVFVFVGLGKNYCISQGKRKQKKFKDNRLTSSKKRWDLWEKIILKDNPQIITGGATNRWVNESFKACRKVRDNSQNIKGPVLLLKAEKDVIVDPESMDLFCEKTSCEKVSFKTAKHEILMEKDSIRDMALHHIINFIKEKSRN